MVADLANTVSAVATPTRAGAEAASFRESAHGGRHGHGGRRHGLLAPVGEPRHAGPGQPRPLPLRANRTGRTTPGTAWSSRPTAARYPDRCRCRGRQPALTTSRTRYRSSDALYIPGAPSLDRTLKDNLSDPRCSARHSPLPHRVPPGRSPFTVAPVNRTPAGLPEPGVGRIRRLPAERSPPEVALPSVGSPSGPLPPLRRQQPHTGLGRRPGAAAFSTVAVRYGCRATSLTHTSAFSTLARTTTAPGRP